MTSGCRKSRITNLLSWHIAVDIEEKCYNQGEVFRGGISRIYLS